MDQTDQSTNQTTDNLVVDGAPATRYQRPIYIDGKFTGYAPEYIISDPVTRRRYRIVDKNQSYTPDLLAKEFNIRRQQPDQFAIVEPGQTKPSSANSLPQGSRDNVIFEGYDPAERIDLWSTQPALPSTRSSLPSNGPSRGDLPAATPSVVENPYAGTQQDAPPDLREVFAPATLPTATASTSSTYSPVPRRRTVAPPPDHPFDPTPRGGGEEADTYPVNLPALSGSSALFNVPPAGPIPYSGSSSSVSGSNGNPQSSQNPSVPQKPQQKPPKKSFAGFLSNLGTDIVETGKGLVQLPQAVDAVTGTMLQGLVHQGAAFIADAQKDEARRQIEQSLASEKADNLSQMALEMAGGKNGFVGHLGQMAGQSSLLLDPTTDAHTRATALQDLKNTGRETWNGVVDYSYKHPFQQTLNALTLGEGAIAAREAQLAKAARAAELAGNAEKAAQLRNALSNFQKASKAYHAVNHQVQNLGAPKAMELVGGVAEKALGKTAAYGHVRDASNAIRNGFRNVLHGRPGKPIFYPAPAEGKLAFRPDLSAPTEKASAVFAGDVTETTKSTSRPVPDPNSYGADVRRRMKEAKLNYELAYNQAVEDTIQANRLYQRTLKKYMGSGGNYRNPGAIRATSEYAAHITAKQNLLTEQYANDIRAILAAPDSLSKKGDGIQLISLLGEDHTNHAKEGAQFVSDLLSESVAPKQKTINFKEATEKSPLGKRSCYTNNDKTVHLAGKDKGDVAAHELGHWLEYNCPSIQKATFSYYENRTALDHLQPLGPGYESTEMTRKDAFIDKYIGKDYTVNGKRDSTEILSMGIQYLYLDPHNFAMRDPHHFDFVIAALHGQL